jgi:hypothetical protein
MAPFSFIRRSDPELVAHFEGRTAVGIADRYRLPSIGLD